MPFGEQNADRSFGASRRTRSPARDASIDEILKSIQQIIDEEPLTMRGGSSGVSEAAPRARTAEKPVRHRAFDEESLLPAPRKRPARVLRPAAEDDVLAELLAQPTEATLSLEPSPAASLTEARPTPVSALEPAVKAELAPAPLAYELALVNEPPAVMLAVAPEAEPEPAAIASECAPVEAETPTEAPLAIANAIEETPVEPPVGLELAPSPVIAPPVVETQQEQPASINAADALLQSLAAGLAATGFEVVASSPIEIRETAQELAGPATPIVTTQTQTKGPALTPAEAVAAAVAEVVASNSTPSLPGPSGEQAVVSEAEAVAPAADVAADTAQDHAEVAATPAAPMEYAAAAATLPPTLAEGLEDGIATMLRPLLREWLDANLPRMVEKALKEELRERPLVASSSRSA